MKAWKKSVALGLAGGIIGVATDLTGGALISIISIIEVPTSINLLSFGFVTLLAGVLGSIPFSYSGLTLAGGASAIAVFVLAELASVLLIPYWQEEFFLLIALSAKNVLLFSVGFFGCGTLLSMIRARNKSTA